MQMRHPNVGAAQHMHPHSDALSVPLLNPQFDRPNAHEQPLSANYDMQPHGTSSIHILHPQFTPPIVTTESPTSGLPAPISENPLLPPRYERGRRPPTDDAGNNRPRSSSISSFSSRSGSSSRSPSAGSHSSSSSSSHEKKNDQKSRRRHRQTGASEQHLPGPVAFPSMMGTVPDSRLMLPPGMSGGPQPGGPMGPPLGSLDNFGGRSPFPLYGYASPILGHQHPSMGAPLGHPQFGGMMSSMPGMRSEGPFSAGMFPGGGPRSGIRPGFQSSPRFMLEGTAPHLSDESLPTFPNAAAAPNRLPAHKPVRLTQPKHPLAPPGTPVYFKYGEEHYPEETVPQEYTFTESDGTICRYITNFLVYNKRGERLLPIEVLDQPRHAALVLYGSLLPATAMAQNASRAGRRTGDVEADNGRGKKRAATTTANIASKRHTSGIRDGRRKGDADRWLSDRTVVGGISQTYPVRVELAEWCIDYGQEPTNVPFIWLISRWDVYYRLEKPAGRYIPTFATAKMKFEVSTRVIKTLQHRPDTHYKTLVDLLTAATRLEKSQRKAERRAQLKKERNALRHQKLRAIKQDSDGELENDIDKFRTDEKPGLLCDEAFDGKQDGVLPTKKKNRNWRIQSLSTPQGTGVMVQDATGRPQALTPWGASYAVDGFKESMLLGLAEFLESQLRNFMEGVGGASEVPNLLNTPFMRSLRERTALRMETIQLMEAKRRALEVAKSVAEASVSGMPSAGPMSLDASALVPGEMQQGLPPGSSNDPQYMSFGSRGPTPNGYPNPRPNQMFADGSQQQYFGGRPVSMLGGPSGMMANDVMNVNVLESEIQQLQLLLKDSDDEDDNDDDDDDNGESDTDPGRVEDSDGRLGSLGHSIGSSSDEADGDPGGTRSRGRFVTGQSGVFHTIQQQQRDFQLPPSTTYDIDEQDVGLCPTPLSNGSPVRWRRRKPIGEVVDFSADTDDITEGHWGELELKSSDSAHSTTTGTTPCIFNHNNGFMLNNMENSYDHTQVNNTSVLPQPTASLLTEQPQQSNELEKDHLPDTDADIYYNSTVSVAKQEEETNSISQVTVTVTPQMTTGLHQQAGKPPSFITQNKANMAPLISDRDSIATPALQTVQQQLYQQNTSLSMQATPQNIQQPMQPCSPRVRALQETATQPLGNQLSAMQTSIMHPSAIQSSAVQPPTLQPLPMQSMSMQSVPMQQGQAMRVSPTQPMIHQQLHYPMVQSAMHRQQPRPYPQENVSGVPLYSPPLSSQYVYGAPQQRFLVNAKIMPQSNDGCRDMIHASFANPYLPSPWDINFFVPSPNIQQQGPNVMRRARQEMSPKNMVKAPASVPTFDRAAPQRPVKKRKFSGNIPDDVTLKKKLINVKLSKVTKQLNIAPPPFPRDVADDLDIAMTDLKLSDFLETFSIWLFASPTKHRLPRSPPVSPSVLNSLITTSEHQVTSLDYLMAAVGRLFCRKYEKLRASEIAVATYNAQVHAEHSLYGTEKKLEINATLPYNSWLPSAITSKQPPQVMTSFGWANASSNYAPVEVFLSQATLRCMSSLTKYISLIHATKVNPLSSTSVSLSTSSTAATILLNKAVALLAHKSWVETQEPNDVDYNAVDDVIPESTPAKIRIPKPLDLGFGLVSGIQWWKDEGCIDSLTWEFFLRMTLWECLCAIKPDELKQRRIFAEAAMAKKKKRKRNTLTEVGTTPPSKLNSVQGTECEESTESREETAQAGDDGSRILDSDEEEEFSNDNSFWNWELDETKAFNSGITSSTELIRLENIMKSLIGITDSANGNTTETELPSSCMVAGWDHALDKTDRLYLIHWLITVLAKSSMGREMIERKIEVYNVARNTVLLKKKLHNEKPVAEVPDKEEVDTNIEGAAVTDLTPSDSEVAKDSIVPEVKKLEKETILQALESLNKMYRFRKECLGTDRFLNRYYYFNEFDGNGALFIEFHVLIPLTKPSDKNFRLVTVHRRRLPVGVSTQKDINYTLAEQQGTRSIEAARNSRVRGRPRKAADVKKNETNEVSTDLQIEEATCDTTLKNLETLKVEKVVDAIVDIGSKEEDKKNDVDDSNIALDNKKPSTNEVDVRRSGRSTKGQRKPKTTVTHEPLRKPASQNADTSGLAEALKKKPPHVIASFLEIPSGDSGMLYIRRPLDDSLYLNLVEDSDTGSSKFPLKKDDESEEDVYHLIGPFRPLPSQLPTKRKPNKDAVLENPNNEDEQGIPGEHTPEVDEPDLEVVKAAPVILWGRTDDRKWIESLIESLSCYTVRERQLKQRLSLVLQLGQINTDKSEVISNKKATPAHFNTLYTKLQNLLNRFIYFKTNVLDKSISPLRCNEWVRFDELTSSLNTTLPSATDIGSTPNERLIIYFLLNAVRFARSVTYLSRLTAPVPGSGWNTRSSSSQWDTEMKALEWALNQFGSSNDIIGSMISRVKTTLDETSANVVEQVACDFVCLIALYFTLWIRFGLNRLVIEHLISTTTQDTTKLFHCDTGTASVIKVGAWYHLDRKEYLAQLTNLKNSGVPAVDEWLPPHAKKEQSPVVLVLESWYHYCPIYAKEGSITENKKTSSASKKNIRSSMNNNQTTTTTTQTVPATPIVTNSNGDGFDPYVRLKVVFAKSEDISSKSNSVNEYFFVFVSLKNIDACLEAI